MQTAKRCIGLNMWMMLGLSVLLLAGCIAPIQPQATAGNDSESMIPLKLSAAPFLSYAPIYIALEEGFFAEEGLDIELVQFTRAADAVPALAQGQIDVMGVNVTSSTMNVIARDAQIRLVASMAQKVNTGCAFNALVLRHGTAVDDAEELTAEILQSLRYYVNPTVITAQGLDIMLQSYGLSLGDITIVDLPGNAAVLDPLQQGTVDVVSLTEPWVTRALTTGAADVWWDQEDIMPGSQSSVIAFGPSLLGGDSEAGERFMVAYLRAVRQLAEGKTERNLEILEQSMELERDFLLEVCWPYIPADGSVLVDSLEDFSVWAAERDYIDNPLTGDMFWDSSFIDHANQVLSAR